MTEAKSADVDVPAAAAAVARRYRRVERPVSVAVGLAVGLASAVALVSWWLLPGLAIALALFAVVRAPTLQTRSSARLVTDESADVVRQEFAGATPPVLARQWGIADRVTEADGEAQYELNYLFGLGSISMTCVAEAAPAGRTDPHTDHALVLRVTAGGSPWATYEVAIDDRGDRTVVDVTSESDRRFGLRAIPQWLVARRYQEPILTAQGYAVESEEHSFTL